MPLNYYAINRVIGGRMVPGRRPSFGGFGSLRVQAGRFKGEIGDVTPAVAFSVEMERNIARAFEDVRGGRAPDAILWDKNLANRFYKRCRELDVLAPSAALGRRLIQIRKLPGRYAKYGIRLSPSVVTEPRPSIVWEHAHAIEYALVTLKYQYGSSIDDILIDPAFALEFDSLATKVSPRLTSRDVRLAALYIRKTRHLAKREASLFENLDFSGFRRRLRFVGTVADAANWTPGIDGGGLFQLVEKEKSLFVGRSPNLRAVLEEVAKPTTLSAMANLFWKPDPHEIAVEAFVGSGFRDVGLSKWQIGLIRENQPILNWPVSA